MIRIPPSLRAGVRSGGFTLIEVLLATVLLAAGMALTFASLRAAGGTVQRGETLAYRNEDMRAVQGFLRRRISAARSLPFHTNEETGVQERFAGDAQTMRFVADTPDYLSRGGPHLHTISMDRDGGRVRLLVTLEMVQAGEVVRASEPPQPEVLADDLEAVQFRYRALTPEGRPGEWLETWQDPSMLPLQVQILIRDANGRQWPPMIAALALAGDVSMMQGDTAL